MFAHSVVTKSGQLWKLHVSFVLIVAGGISMFWGQSHIETYLGGWLLTGGMATVFAAFAFACAGIRCPSCGAKWFWLAISAQPSNQWTHWLLSQPACPICKEEFPSAGT